MALYPTVPICIQLTDYELETPDLGVAPIYRTVLPPPPYNPSLYPALHDVEPQTHNLPEYVALVGVHPVHQIGTNSSVCEPSKQTPEKQESRIVTKEVILNKKDGKFGIKTAVINKNVFIYKVSKGSSAARADLKLGDQILKVNGISVTGMSNDSVHELIRRCPQYGIKFTVRSRKDYTIFKKLESVKKTFGDL